MEQKIKEIREGLKNTKKNVLVYIALEALRVSAIAKIELDNLYRECKCKECRDKIREILTKIGGFNG